MPMDVMDIDDVQKTLWIHQPEAPQTTQEALARISQSLIDTINAFQMEQLVSSQVHLEETLSHVLVAMKTLNLQPSQAVFRTVRRMKRYSAPVRSFHVFRDRVEIHVGDEVRGGWSLYTPEDYESAVRLAETFDCPVMHHEAEQLDLFQLPKAALGHSRSQPTNRNRVTTPFQPAEGSRPKLTVVAGKATAQ